MSSCEEHECKNCGHEFTDEEASGSDDEGVVCPECGTFNYVDE